MASKVIKGVCLLVCLFVLFLTLVHYLLGEFTYHSGLGFWIKCLCILLKEFLGPYCFSVHSIHCWVFWLRSFTIHIPGCELTLTFVMKFKVTILMSLKVNFFCMKTWKKPLSLKFKNFTRLCVSTDFFFFF